MLVRELLFPVKTVFGGISDHDVALTGRQNSVRGARSGCQQQMAARVPGGCLRRLLRGRWTPLQVFLRARERDRHKKGSGRPWGCERRRLDIGWPRMSGEGQAESGA